MKPPMILLDGMWLAHRANRSLEGLEFEDFPTGVLYGFFEQLRTLSRDEHLLSTSFCVFWDSRKSFRRREYPGYKQNRRENLAPEEQQRLKVLWDQTNLLRRTILPELGIACYRQTGVESDDLIASAAQQYTGKERQAVIVTSDSDLYQSISDAVHWYDPSRHRYLDPSTFIEQKGISPSRWGEVKSLMGCPSDGVKGIRGVGEKTAKAFLLGLLPRHHRIYQFITSPEGVRMREQAARLVILPHERTIRVIPRRPRYDVGAFFRMCERYGFASYLTPTRRRSWEAFFRGYPTSSPRMRGEKR